MDTILSSQFLAGPVPLFGLVIVGDRESPPGLLYAGGTRNSWGISVSAESLTKAIEIRIRAERRAGQLLADAQRGYGLGPGTRENQSSG
jgi:hypothetical protein